MFTDNRVRSLPRAETDAAQGPPVLSVADVATLTLLVQAGVTQPDEIQHFLSRTSDYARRVGWYLATGSFAEAHGAAVASQVKHDARVILRLSGAPAEK